MRVYHGGRTYAGRARERALAALGVDVTLVVPASWPEPRQEEIVDSVRAVALPVARAGDVNRHRYRHDAELARLLAERRPDVLDIHEEPFSVAARQWCRAAPSDMPIVLYTAQNIDKRFPPPFAGFERRAYRRAAALYPCSRQAASVARGKGFAGLIDVLPLGYDPDHFRPGRQSHGDEELRLALVGRLVPEKGAEDAVHALAAVHAVRPARLIVAGEGPDARRALECARRLGLRDRVELVGWQSEERLAAIYRTVHVALVPSSATPTWAEQFGRVIVEAQASGAVVAAYASGAIPEVGGDAALVVGEGRADLLGAAVASLALDGEAWAARRELGIRQAAARTWPAVAARQLTLYRRVLEGGRRERLPHGRARARAEFGPTAATPVGSRPVALPGLRRSRWITRFLGGAVDAVGRLRSPVDE
jgi:glycosyltransferase involved in cell wall biosynthesis